MKQYNRVNLGLLIKMRRTEMGLTQSQLATSIGMGRAAINSIENGHSTAPLDRIIALNHFFGLNLIDNDLILRDEDGITNEEYLEITKDKAVVHLGDQISDVANSQDPKNRFIALPNGKFLQAVDLVEAHTEAGYLDQFLADQGYYQSPEKHFIVVTQEHQGQYLAWRVKGHSMDDGTKESIPNGSIVTGRFIRKDLWTNRFHLHKWKYYTIVHKTGVITKQIIDHDVPNGIITLHSLNPDKIEYPDFQVHLDDCYAIYNVVDKTVSTE